MKIKIECIDKERRLHVLALIRSVLYGAGATVEIEGDSSYNDRIELARRDRKTDVFPPGFKISLQATTPRKEYTGERLVDPFSVD